MLKQETALKRIQANEQHARLLEELKRQKAAREMAELQVASYQKQVEELREEIGQEWAEREEKPGKQDIVLASEQLREIKKRGRKEKSRGTENQAPRRVKSIGKRD